MGWEDNTEDDQTLKVRVHFRGYSAAHEWGSPANLTLSSSHLEAFAVNSVGHLSQQACRLGEEGSLASELSAGFAAQAVVTVMS